MHSSRFFFRAAFAAPQGFDAKAGANAGIGASEGVKAVNSGETGDGGVLGPRVGRDRGAGRPTRGRFAARGCEISRGAGNELNGDGEPGSVAGVGLARVDGLELGVGRGGELGVLVDGTGTLGRGGGLAGNAPGVDAGTLGGGSGGAAAGSGGRGADGTGTVGGRAAGGGCGRTMGGSAIGGVGIGNGGGMPGETGDERRGKGLVGRGRRGRAGGRDGARRRGRGELGPGRGAGRANRPSGPSARKIGIIPAMMSPPSSTEPTDGTRSDNLRGGRRGRCCGPPMLVPDADDGMGITVPVGGGGSNPPGGGIDGPVLSGGAGVDGTLPGGSAPDAICPLSDVSPRVPVSPREPAATVMPIRNPIGSNVGTAQPIGAFASL